MQLKLGARPSWSLWLASRQPTLRPPSELLFGALFRRSDVFGVTPKTAVETTALPKARAFFLLSAFAQTGQLPGRQQPVEAGAFPKDQLLHRQFAEAGFL